MTRFHSCVFIDLLKVGLCPCLDFFFWWCFFFFVRGKYWGVQPASHSYQYNSQQTFTGSINGHRQPLIIDHLSSPWMSLSLFLFLLLSVSLLSLMGLLLGRKKAARATKREASFLRGTITVSEKHERRRASCTRLLSEVGLSSLARGNT